MQARPYGNCRPHGDHACGARGSKTARPIHGARCGSTGAYLRADMFVGMHPLSKLHKCGSGYTARIHQPHDPRLEHKKCFIGPIPAAFL